MAGSGEGEPGSVRPLRADARRNRESVIAAAVELIERDGLAVPLDEIARHAGVGAGTVYRHFPTKESLFAAIVVDRVGQVADQVRALAVADDPGQALVRALSLMLAEGERSVALKAALAGTDFDLRAAAPGAARDLRDAVGALLGRAQDAGTIRRDLDTDDIMALLAGAFAAAQHFGDDPRRTARLSAVLFDGLLPRTALTRTTSSQESRSG
jgi:AcrR family transcriptional regulator